MAEVIKNKAGNKGSTKDIVLSEGLEEIREYAYSDITLERVVIPKSVKAIGKKLSAQDVLKYTIRSSPLYRGANPF